GLDRARSVAEGGVGADADRRRDAARIDVEPAGVYAVGGDGRAGDRRYVGRREAEVGAARRAVDDGALDAEVVPEDLGRRGDVALGDARADPSRGEGLPVGGERLGE